MKNNKSNQSNIDQKKKLIDGIQAIGSSNRSIAIYFKLFLFHINRFKTVQHMAEKKVRENENVLIIKKMHR